MRALLQNFSKGGPYLADVPIPNVASGQVVIRNECSLVSMGTEMMLVDFGEASLLGKAFKQPERLKDVLRKMQTDGLLTTVDAVRSKLNAPIPLGYSCVGTVVDLAPDLKHLKVGDRVAANGPHADYCLVSGNLCARVPDGVSSHQAAFTVVGSIAMQSIRLAKPTIGESFVVIGVGLIGQIAVQLLRANGCRVIALDRNEERLQLCRRMGAETCEVDDEAAVIATVDKFSRGRGCDGVIVAAATTSSVPLKLGAEFLRKRGRMVLVGVAGMDLDRKPFYEKEISFSVSCSYGPGRYDKNYEDQNQDYPFGFVRWTAQRNFEAILELLGTGDVDVEPLITHRHKFEKAPEVYEKLGQANDALGVLFDYQDSEADLQPSRSISIQNTLFQASKPIVGVVGAGNYASRVLIPALKKANAQLHTLVSLGGVNAAVTGKKFGFSYVSSDVEDILNSDEINTVFVVTQHDTHAHFAAQALRAGKNVFVEKPLAIDQNGLDGVLAALQNISSEASERGVPQLCVGYNRRRAPQILEMKRVLDGFGQPLQMVMTMNAGYMPADHWTQNIAIGGGRLIGEACHYIDLMRYLVGERIKDARVFQMSPSSSAAATEENLSIQLTFEDGSLGTILYLANGHPSFPKERIEVFSGGRILQLDNFQRLQGFGWPKLSAKRLFRQDKGQNAFVLEFLSCVKEGRILIEKDELVDVATTAINLAGQLRT